MACVTTPVQENTEIGDSTTLFLQDSGVLDLLKETISKYMSNIEIEDIAEATAY